MCLPYFIKVLRAIQNNLSIKEFEVVWWPLNICYLSERSIDFYGPVLTFDIIKVVNVAKLHVDTLQHDE